MAHLPLTPQLVTDLLVVAFFLTGMLGRNRRSSPVLQTPGRGTTLVFGGCYAITLVALNFTAPAPITAAPPVGWIGVLAAAGGLARIVATLAAPRPAGVPARRHPDSHGNLVFWVGAAAASLNVIAMLTVTVAMLAATGVRRSAEAAGSGRPGAAGAPGRSGDPGGGLAVSERLFPGRRLK